MAKHQNKLRRLINHKQNANYNKFPTTTKQIKLGDFWLAHYPFKEKGNMEKLRPVKIININKENETYFVQKITSNPSKGKPINIPNTRHPSYLTNEFTTLTFDKFFRKL